MFKEDQCQAVLGLITEVTKGFVAVLPIGFFEKFSLPVVCGSETQTKRKERGIVVASPLRSIINDQVEVVRGAGISAIALPCRGTMR